MVPTERTARPDWARPLGVLLLLQCLGAAGGLRADGSHWTHFAVAHGWIDLGAAGVADGVGAWIIGGLAAVVLLREGAVRRVAAGLLTVWFLAEALFISAKGVAFASELAVFALALRFVVPALVAWPVSEATLRAGLRLAVASVFAAHGAEALLGHPQFMSFLTVVPTATVGLVVGPAAAAKLLVLIGIVDIAVAIGIAMRARPELLWWAAFWGVLTAMVRILFFGLDAGWHLSLIRAANGGVPLVYWWMVYGREQVALRRVNHAR